MKEHPFIKASSGIMQQRNIIFRETSLIGQEMHFYLMWGAEFICTLPYKVNRSYLNSFILFKINSGELKFIYDGKAFTAGPNDCVILDCKVPHTYYAEKEVCFHWFHFSGGTTQQIYSYVSKRDEILHKSERAGLTGQLVNMFFEELKENTKDEFEVSLLIYRILMSFLHTNKRTVYSEGIKKAMNYIDAHIEEELPVERLAHISHLSKFYFIKIFHEETGETPHQYVIRRRVSLSKELLISSHYSLDFIAQKTGFNSRSNFIRCFCKYNGCTPGKFRKHY